MSNTGFIKGTMLQIPGAGYDPATAPDDIDTTDIYDLEVGDEVIGFNEVSMNNIVQTVESIYHYKAPGALAFGCAPKQQIYMRGKFRNADETFKEKIMGDTTLIVVEVTPDHTFKLASGLRVHNGGGPETTTQAGTTDQRSTTTRAADPGQAAIIAFAQQAAQDAFAGRDLSPFAGKLSAGPTAASRQANQMQIDLARQLMGENKLATAEGLFAGTGGGGVGPTLSNFGMQQLRDLGTQTARGDFLRPESNPFLQANIDIINRSAGEQAQQALLANRSQAIAQGAFGGSANALQAAQVQQDISQGAADRTSQIALDNYIRERQMQNAVGNIFGQAQGIEGASIRDVRSAQAAASSRANAARSQRLQDLLRPIELLRGAGAERQGFKQTRLDARLKQDLLNRQLTNSMQGLDALFAASGLGGQFGTTTGLQTGTTTQDVTQPGTGLFEGILGGIAGIGGVGTALAGFDLSGLFGKPTQPEGFVLGKSPFTDPTFG